MIKGLIQACTVIDLRIADHDYSIDIRSLVVRSCKSGDRDRMIDSDWLFAMFRSNSECQIACLRHLCSSRWVQREVWISFVVASPLRTEPWMTERVIPYQVYLELFVSHENWLITLLQPPVHVIGQVGHSQFTHISGCKWYRGTTLCFVRMADLEDTLGDDTVMDEGPTLSWMCLRPGRRATGTRRASAMLR